MTNSGRRADQSDVFARFRATVFMQSGDLVEWATVPISFFKNGRTTFDRTGILLAIADHHFVITAEHDLEEISAAGYEPCIVPASPERLETPMLIDRMYVSHDPAIDIAVFRLHHEVPAHHNAEANLDTYLSVAAITATKDTPLFRSLDRRRRLTRRRIHRLEVLAMIKRRAAAAELPDTVSCHTFRATGITAYLDNGGTIENAQRIAAHESPRTTKLYDRTGDDVSLDEIERIVI